MADAQQALIDIVGAADVLTGDDIGDDYLHDEALTSVPSRPVNWRFAAQWSSKVSRTIETAMTRVAAAPMPWMRRQVSNSAKLGAIAAAAAATT